MSEYNSSEELQLANRGVFADKAAEKARKKAQANQSEREQLHRVLDKYIAEHTKTTDVREMAKKNNRTADYQLDLSADIVEILEKIKTELR